MVETPFSRRSVLVGAAVGLSGCPAGSPGGTDPGPTGSGGTDGDDGETPGPTATTTGDRDGTEPRPTATPAGTDTPGGTTAVDGGGGLNLAEANVVGVKLAGSGEATRFSVTLYHDDDGEDGYANWWQVESLDGERLGRRDLSHPHSTAPFTRSETVAVPDDAPCVVVRGHDRTHGYGGRAMLVDPESGATVARDQGTEPRTFDAGDCP